MLSYVLVALLSISLAGLLLPRRGSFTFWDRSSQGPPARLLSSRELSVYGGHEGSRGLYLAILGQVFDVNKGHKHYGPGGHYHSLTGKDASLAFITGDFSERGLSDDVSSLSPLQVVALYDWLSFYRREYPAVVNGRPSPSVKGADVWVSGLVTGRFYSKTGKPTEALQRVEASRAEGLQIKAQSEAEKSRLPNCNSEWSAARGGRVWCSTKSGGVTRAWTGVPRKLFSAGSSGVRCVCVETPSKAEEDPNLQKYDNCPPHADSCSVGEF